MYLYHYVANTQVEELMTSKMLGRQVEGDHGDTLSAFYAPLGKSNIEKLRRAGFSAWKPALYLYRFDLANARCNNIRVSSLPQLEGVTHLYDHMSRSGWSELKKTITPLAWDCTKSMIREDYKKYKLLYEDVDVQVAKQIAIAKYDPDRKWANEVKRAYAYYIPHVMLYLTQPVSKIKYLGKF